MATERENEIYFAARDRALERHVEGTSLYEEAASGFHAGLHMTDRTSDGYSFSDIVEKIKTETNFGFGFICGVLARLEAVKGKHYAGSWQKRGEPGVLANVHRKTDRLEELINTDSQAGENLSQTLGDGAVYAIKWMTLRAELDPEEFLKWVKEVQGL
jgi:hypothetical protein